MVFDRASEDQADATCQRQQRVWALLAERWASPEEVEDLKRMKDRWFILFQTHGVVENGRGCFMHFHVAYTKKDRSQVINVLGGSPS